MSPVHMPQPNPPREDPPTLHAALIFSYSSLANLPVCWFWKRAEDLRVACKVLTGYGWDNHHLRVQNLYGEEFAISVNRTQAQPGSPMAKSIMARHKITWDRVSEHHEVHLWNHQGHTAVYDGSFLAKYNQPIPEEVCKAMTAAMENFTKGSVPCADCGDPVPHREAAAGGRRYFAALYCSPCWLGEKGRHKGRGGWKAVEAKESYD